MPNFLTIDDSSSFHVFLKKRLEQKWPDALVNIYDPKKSGKPDDNYSWNDFDLIFLDYDLGYKNETGLDWIPVIKKNSPSTPVVILTGEGNEEIAVKAIKQGADSYIIKYDLADDLFYEEVVELLALHATTQSLKENRDFDDDQTISALNQTQAVNIELSGQDEYINKWGVPGYFCVREIAQGSWSTTFLAESNKIQQQVIVKVLEIKDVTEPVLIKRFMQELTLLSSLKHPNVISTIDYGFTDDYAYYTMEYLSNGDLSNKLEQGIMKPEIILKYILSIAKGLSALHDLNIIHRDIKPNNILFKDDGDLVIADLGIAKDLSCSEIMTAEGEILGTPFYMSPEQINGKPFDLRADIYSLGILFYELLTGEKPFTGDSIIEVACQHAHDEPPSLPVELAEYQGIIEKLLAKNPSDRYQDTHEIINVLSELIN